MSAGIGRSSSPARDKPNQSFNRCGATEKNNSEPEASSPGKKKQLRPRANASKSDKGQGKAKDVVQEGKVTSGQKRKSVQGTGPKQPQC
jgi:hypothetical protein